MTCLTEPIKARAIFLQAIEIDSPEERAAILARPAKTTGAARIASKRLLNFPPSSSALFHARHRQQNHAYRCPVTGKAGTRIGPYKLLQQLGEGGMGVVYMAEQTEPVERRVAVKIIKAGNGLAAGDRPF